MLRCCRAAVLLTALVLAASAGGSLPAFSDVNIRGSVDCGKWIEGRSQKTSKLLEAHLQGTLNGMPPGSSIEFWRAGGVEMSTAQVFLWMDKYCRENPLSDTVDGAIKLMNERTGNAWARHAQRLGN